MACREVSVASASLPSCQDRGGTSTKRVGNGVRVDVCVGVCDAVGVCVDVGSGVDDGVGVSVFPEPKFIIGFGRLIATGPRLRLSPPSGGSFWSSFKRGVGTILGAFCN